jgi:hypothetical protein
MKERLLTDEQYIEIKQTDKGFEYWANRPFIGESLRKSILESDLILIPIENFRENTSPMFYQGTREVFQKLKDDLTNRKIEAAIEDSDYKELVLHSDLLRLGCFLVDKIVLPLFLAWLYDYIKSKKFELDNVFMFKLIIANRCGLAQEITFSGTKQDFEEEVLSKAKTKNDFPNDYKKIFYPKSGGEIIDKLA